ncbi:MAG TPA: oligosaccharide flippase family protein [Dehalococcoidia bacterium]|nr:oligosaccharide flippase family protein [Dehalococcoidia bacterium]
MTTEPQTASTRFLFNVNVLFFSQLVNYALQFILTIIIARGLGAAGRGDYALFVLSTTLAASVGTLGVGLGSIYYVGKAKHGVRVLLGNSQFLVLVGGAVAATILLTVGLTLGTQGFLKGDSYWLHLLAFPAVLEFLLVTALLVGQDRFVGLNASQLSQTLLLLAGAATLLVLDEMTIFAVLAVWSASFLFATVVALAFVGFENLSSRAALKPDWTAFSDQVRLGVPGQAGNVLQYLNYRLDQFLVRAIRTRAEVGVYSVAVALSESVWWISNAVSLALLPRLTRMEPERAAEVTPVACRNTLLISAIGAAALAALARVLVKPLFGSDFSDVPDAMALLMPGIVALSGTKVLSSYIFSQGKVALNSAAALVALAVTLALDAALIPRFGVDGAAAASSVAYGTSMVLTLYFYRRLSGGGIWACTLPSPSDASLYAGLVRRVWGRLAGSRAAASESEIEPGA